MEEFLQRRPSITSPVTVSVKANNLTYVVWIKVWLLVNSLFVVWHWSQVRHLMFKIRFQMVIWIFFYNFHKCLKFLGLLHLWLSHDQWLFLSSFFKSLIGKGIIAVNCNKRINKLVMYIAVSAGTLLPIDFLYLWFFPRLHP